MVSYFYLVTLSQNTFCVWRACQNNSDESIDFVDSEAVNAYGSVVAKEEHENPCEYFEEGENVDPPRFHPFIKFAILVK